MTAASYIDPLNGRLYPLSQPRWCSDDRTPLLVTPGSGISREDIVRGTRSLWRYRAALPGDIADPITMGEGCTPLVQRRWGDLRPFFKLEWFNPTSSFKDRGTSVMLSFLRQLGIEAVLEDSSGNGGSSVAGFGAAGGINVKILAPSYTSPAKIAQVVSYGAEVQLVDGPREESEAEAIRQSERVFYASHNWQPLFLEGTKSFAYEIWEDLDFKAPDNIIMPAGAGSSVLGCAFGFRELLKAGQITKLPRLFVAQPLNCSPIDASFTAGSIRPCRATCIGRSPKGRQSPARFVCARSSGPCGRAAAVPSLCPRTRSPLPCVGWHETGSSLSRPARRQPAPSTSCSIPAPSRTARRRWSSSREPVSRPPRQWRNSLVSITVAVFHFPFHSKEAGRSSPAPERRFRADRRPWPRRGRRARPLQQRPRHDEGGSSD